MSRTSLIIRRRKGARTFASQEPDIDDVWILATGFWNDNGVWLDDSLWID